MFLKPIPLSLYIHIPWCVRKCPYCDFNSHEARAALPEEEYVNALLADLEEQAPRLKDRQIVSIFFGGGTPSLFSAKSIERILTGVHAHLPLAPTVEVTLEANPGTIDQARFMELKPAGINRLSLGVQSFQEDKLKLLGRIHDGKAAQNAIEYAQKCGFNNLNIDLMFGLPTQSIADALSDLETALSFAPTHLSWYQLTIEPNTVFYRYPPTLPPDGLLWDMQIAGQTLLRDRQLFQYEVSAYSKINFPCQHNLNYWQFGDYLGIGAGAHSKITTEGIVTRHAQVKQPKDYLDPKKNKTANQSVLSEQDLIFEFMLNALRLTEGVPRELFGERTGLPSSKIEPIIEEGVAKKLLKGEVGRIQPTELGKRFLNDLVGMFLEK